MNWKLSKVLYKRFPLGFNSIHMIISTRVALTLSKKHFKVSWCCQWSVLAGKRAEFSVFESNWVVTFIWKSLLQLSIYKNGPLCSPQAGQSLCWVTVSDQYSVSCLWTLQQNRCGLPQEHEPELDSWRTFSPTADSCSADRECLCSFWYFFYVGGHLREPLHWHQNTEKQYFHF